MRRVWPALATLLRFHSTPKNTNSAFLRATISQKLWCIYMTSAGQTGITSHSTRQYTCKAMRAPAEYKNAFVRIGIQPIAARCVVLSIMNGNR